ncbi:MAG TPA: 2,3,4,5-tetrahydropyridine-2,6-dicarboxylate N-succinyltransferase [Sphingomonadales bacterium]|nr:2,3,4,5-tetrahydropyridine-2,6-dicarboxylate N-succinyltransferase [Sphingomonadales bacterium]
MPALETVIEEAFQRLPAIGPGDAAEGAVREVLAKLDSGTLRAAVKTAEGYAVNALAKKAVLLAFRLFPSAVMGEGAFDKIPLKFAGWGEADFQKAGIRALPGAVVRSGAFIGEGAVLMPCFVNVGAYIGKNTMIDTWASVGSCAQVGDNVHVSGGAGIGGVLEPLQAAPVVIEDGAFLGARSEVAEGVIIGEGAVLAMGVYLSQSTPIYDRAAATVAYGRVPPYSVLIPGALPARDASHSTYAAIIVKKVDARTRTKVSINELLRP